MRSATNRALRAVPLSALLAAGALGLAACGGGSSPTPAGPSKDYTSEARSAIDEKNMDSELQKLRAEIESDTK